MEGGSLHFGSRLFGKGLKWHECTAENTEKAALTSQLRRDQYGIPDVRSIGMRIRRVVEKETKPEVPEDLYNLIKKSVNLHKHMGDNKKDSRSKHGLELVESKIRRLGKYYVKKGRLPGNWKYTIEKAKLLEK